MTSAEFDKQVVRLRAAYGPQMHDEFTALLWRRVSDRDGRNFEKSVDQMIEERALLKMSVILETMNAKEKSYSNSSGPSIERTDEPVRASELADTLKQRLRIISGNGGR